MIRFASRRASGLAAALSLCCALPAIVEPHGEGALAQPFRMQAAPPTVPSPEARQAFQARIDEQARLLARDRRLAHLSLHERQAVVERVAGNVLIAAIHRLGLALLSDLGVPVLGGAEQTADDFAILTLLELGKSHFSDRILMEAAKGWFTRMRRNERGLRDADMRGPSARRAYRMVCLMAGADAMRFKALPEETALPRQVQRNCGADYDRAVRAWDMVLRPHRPATGQPKTRIEVRYGAAAGHLAIHAELFRNLGFLEAIAETAASQVSWSAPFQIEMRSCGAAGASWAGSARTLSVCYETAEEVAEPDRLGQERGR